MQGEGREGKGPKLTRALTRASWTPLQRRLADREYVIFAAFVFGCSVRMIASALGLHPARVRQVLEGYESDESAPPEDSPESL